MGPNPSPFLPFFIFSFFSQGTQVSQVISRLGVCPFFLLLRGWVGGARGGGRAPFFSSLRYPGLGPIVDSFRRKFPLSGDAGGLIPTAHQAHEGLISPINVRSAPSIVCILTNFSFPLYRLIGGPRRGVVPICNLKIHVLIYVLTCV